MRPTTDGAAAWIPPELERLARCLEKAGDVDVARRLRVADFHEDPADRDDLRRVVRDVRSAIESAAALGGRARASQLLDALLDATARRDAVVRRAAAARAAGAPSWIPPVPRDWPSDDRDAQPWRRIGPPRG
jgi:hypothetical protein